MIASPYWFTSESTVLSGGSSPGLSGLNNIEGQLHDSSTFHLFHVKYALYYILKHIYYLSYDHKWSIINSTNKAPMPSLISSNKESFPIIMSRERPRRQGGRWGDKT